MSKVAEGIKCPNCLYKFICNKNPFVRRFFKVLYKRTGFVNLRTPLLIIKIDSLILRLQKLKN